MNNYEKRQRLWGKRICLKEEQYQFIKEVKKKKKYKTMAGTLDFIINNFKTMGILDYVPIEEFKPKKQAGSVEVTCEKCLSKFMGYLWMLKSNKPIICPRCWRYERLDEEENS